jgi:hypothetical protein
MKTNYLMLKELLEQYTPKERGIANRDEIKLIKDTLCLKDMDILQLRNLRDFTVAHLGHSDSLVDWDRMSAITYVIDTCIVRLGGEV